MTCSNWSAFRPERKLPVPEEMIPLVAGKRNGLSPASETLRQASTKCFGQTGTLPEEAVKLDKMNIRFVRSYPPAARAAEDPDLHVTAHLGLVQGHGAVDFQIS